jgi:hypothetical protein
MAEVVRVINLSADRLTAVTFDVADGDDVTAYRVTAAELENGPPVTPDTLSDVADWLIGDTVESAVIEEEVVGWR